MPAARPRRYDDACGTAHALELVGDRWALLVVRELLLGPKRFSDLRRDLPGLSANVLATRLSELSATGVLRRDTLPRPAAAQVYGLTEWGHELRPIVREFGRWAARSPRYDPSLPLTATSLMLSFETMLVPQRAVGTALRTGFNLGGESFVCEVNDGRIESHRAESSEDEGAEIISARAEPVAAWIYGRVPAAELEAQGALRVVGDRACADRFATLFSLPPKSGLPVP